MKNEKEPRRLIVNNKNLEKKKKKNKKNKKRLGVGLCEGGYWLGLDGKGLGESLGQGGG